MVQVSDECIGRFNTITQWKSAANTICDEKLRVDKQHILHWLGVKVHRGEAQKVVFQRSSIGGQDLLETRTLERKAKPISLMD